MPALKAYYIKLLLYIILNINYYNAVGDYLWVLVMTNVWFYK